MAAADVSRSASLNLSFCFLSFLRCGLILILGRAY